MNNTNKQIGKITHYYDKIGVAVIEAVKKPISVGTNIKISGHDNEFTQTIDSLQVDKKQVTTVKVGKEAGLKVNQPVKPGDIIYEV